MANDDLISRQAAIDALDGVLVEDESCKVWFKLSLQQLPSAERRGRWIDGNRLQSCSICRYRGKKSWNYCPNCGAQMEVE